MVESSFVWFLCICISYGFYLFVFMSNIFITTIIILGIA
jgi:hypothetical protein